MYRTIDEVFERFLTPSYTIGALIPDGYELVETEAHKKARLEKEIASKKQSLSYLQKHLTELTSQLEQEEKELLELTQHAK